MYPLLLEEDPLSAMVYAMGGNGGEVDEMEGKGAMIQFQRNRAFKWTRRVWRFIWQRLCNRMHVPM